ncbi:MAG: carboxypeptidase-like regulatory domain-containing protein, partial [Flavobacteriaceae bacterium]
FANVQLKNVDKKTETNFHGNFEFNNLKVGNYTLVVSYAGYENIEMPVVVVADNVTQVNLGMSAKQIDFDVVLGTAIAIKETDPSTSTERLH